jgi:hypothetical protein
VNAITQLKTVIPWVSHSSRIEMEDATEKLEKLVEAVTAYRANHCSYNVSQLATEQDLDEAMLDVLGRCQTCDGEGGRVLNPHERDPYLERYCECPNCKGSGVEPEPRALEKAA